MLLDELIIMLIRKLATHGDVEVRCIDLPSQEMYEIRNIPSICVDEDGEVTLELLIAKSDE